MIEIPDNISIRRAREADLPEMARIHHAAYPGFSMTLQETVDRFRTNPRIPLEEYWVCERNDRLAGLYALYTFRMFRQSKIIQTGGIGSVAVAPEARRARIANYMMSHAIDVMDQNGMPLSILYPFRHSFYQHIGWGLIGKIKLYNFAPHTIPNFPERTSVKPVLTASERDAVMQCYNQFASRQNGMVMRDDPYWNEVVLKNSLCYAYVSPDTDKVEGYLTFRYRPHPFMEAFMTSNLEVWDFVWNSRSALWGLLGFLGSQRDQIESIIFPDQSNLPFEHLLSEPLMPKGKQNFLIGAETAHLGSNLMGRVVNLRHALKMMQNAGKGSGKVTLEIQDDHNPINNEPLTVELSKGKAEIVSGKHSGITLKTDISTFSSIYWGALNITDAVMLGKVELSGKGDAGFLKDMFKAPKPMCYDHF